MLFKPIYKEIMWGGSLMSEVLGRDLPSTGNPIAEAWEIVDREDAESIIENGPMAGMSIRDLIEQRSGDFVGSNFRGGGRFPLLVKLIDAGKRLSLQVHPDEDACKELPGAEPKTEMWYVIAAKPDAKIIAGLGKSCTKYKFLESIKNGNVEECLQVFKSVPGDAYFINAGTVHAIGAGNLLLEIQQNSNTTYRISDWGRVGLDGKPRQLHLEEAVKSINFASRLAPRIPNVSNVTEHNRKFPIVNRCPFFHVDDLRLVEEWYDKADGTSMHIISAITGSVTIEGVAESVHVDRGRSCVVPANYGRYSININGDEPVTVVKTTLK